MLENHVRYTFAPDCFAKSGETAGQVYYGWMWSKVFIIVGCLPLETAHERIKEISNLNFQLIGEGLPAVPPLTVLETSGQIDPIWITYRTPNLRAQRFYTIQPLRLDLVLKAEDAKSNAVTTQLDSVINANPVRLRPPGEDTPSMGMILNHINISPVLDQLVQGTLKSSQILVPAGLGQSPPPKSLAPRWDKLANITKHISITPLRFLARVCNVQMPVLYSDSTLAKDISATMQQTDVRLEQVLNSKEQFDATRLENVQGVAHSTARYINFFNCVWLIVNDVIIGFAVGGFICDNKDVLARLTLQYTQWYSIDLLRETLHWLDNWPVGLKLNTELSSFLCNSFAATIEYWSHIVQLTAPYLPLVLYCIGCGGIFGMTMILSLVSDLLGILTLHTYLCYLLATTAFARLLRLLGSLYNLFRGKRRNILRNRTDSWNYDMDQLLLGTILFTLVTFLLPTVTVYYLLFTLTRLAIIGIQASLEIVLAFLNHFPLFALMLRVKDPARLPGGIELHLETHQPTTPDVPITTGLKLVNKPIPFSRIFFQHCKFYIRMNLFYCRAEMSPSDRMVKAVVAL